MVSAHSHAFHRGLRGRSHIAGSGKGGSESFWAWRDDMYASVEHMDPPALRRICELTFREMLRAGITTVGEFHYLHHSLGQHDTPMHDLDGMVVDAAVHANIRLVLLQTYYEQAGLAPNTPLLPAQTHFHTPSLPLFWRHFDMLAQHANPHPTVTLGVAGCPSLLLLLLSLSPNLYSSFHSRCQTRHVEGVAHRVSQTGYSRVPHTSGGTAEGGQHIDG